MRELTVSRLRAFLASVAILVTVTALNIGHVTGFRTVLGNMAFLAAVAAATGTSRGAIFGEVANYAIGQIISCKHTENMEMNGEPTLIALAALNSFSRTRLGTWKIYVSELCIPRRKRVGSPYSQKPYGHLCCGKR